MGVFDIFRKRSGTPLSPSNKPKAHDSASLPSSAILREIETAQFGNDLRAIVDLLPYLPPVSSIYGDAAARAVQALVHQATPDEIAVFDQWYREKTCSGPPRPSWNETRLGPLDAWIHEYPATVCIATFHRNGFVRERAVRSLSDCCDGLELPFLLLRLNDWVPQVRIVAATEIKKRLQIQYGSHWVRCLGLLERIEGGRRGDVDWLQAPVDSLLRRDENRAALEEGLLHGSVGVRRACLRVAAGLDDSNRLLRLALESGGSVTSGQAATLLCKVLEGESLREVVGVMQQGDARSRCLALETICDRFPDEAESALRAALLDHTTCVRELARFKWKKLGLIELCFPEFYLAQLDVQLGDSLVTALRGLAETGTVDDVPVFLKYVDHPRARIREAAVLGLGRCDGRNHLGSITKALGDPNLRVAKAAHRYARIYLGRGTILKRPPKVKPTSP